MPKQKCQTEIKKISLNLPKRLYTDLYALYEAEIPKQIYATRALTFNDFVVQIFINKIKEDTIQ